MLLEPFHSYLHSLLLSDNHHAASVTYSDLHLIIHQYEISEALCAVWEVYLCHSILTLHQNSQTNSQLAMPFLLNDRQYRGGQAKT